MARVDEEEGQTDRVLERMTNKGDALVQALEGMEGNSRLQTTLLQQIYRCLGIFFRKTNEGHYN